MALEVNIKILSRYESIDIFKFSAALDPRWKLRWATPEEASSIRISLINKVKEHLPEATVESYSGSPHPPVEKRCKLFRFMGECPTSSNFNPISVESQVDLYFAQQLENETCNPLNFWQRMVLEYPQLSLLASYYLSTPASSAPVERIFSVAGKIFRPERCCLSDERFEQLIFINCNQEKYD